MIHCGIRALLLQNTAFLNPAGLNGIISQSRAEHCLSHSAGVPLTRGLRGI